MSTPPAARLPSMDTGDITIKLAAPEDFGDLLPLVRSYCDFYEANPTDGDLLALFAALEENPAHEGLQLVARSSSGEPIGFVTLLWSWSTARAGRVGVMEDLFVAPDARGSGVAQALIAECVEQCRRHGANPLAWQTAPGNHRAQRVYDRVGATREEWIDYSLSVDRH